MTEAEWLLFRGYPNDLFEEIPGFPILLKHLDDDKKRKLLLYVIACCQRVCHLLAIKWLSEMVWTEDLTDEGHLHIPNKIEHAVWTHYHVKPESFEVPFEDLPN